MPVELESIAVGNSVGVVLPIAVREEHGHRTGKSVIVIFSDEKPLYERVKNGKLSEPAPAVGPCPCPWAPRVDVPVCQGIAWSGVHAQLKELRVEETDFADSNRRFGSKERELAATRDRIKLLEAFMAAAAGVESELKQKASEEYNRLHPAPPPPLPPTAQEILEAEKASLEAELERMDGFDDVAFRQYGGRRRVREIENRLTAIAAGETAAEKGVSP